MTCGGSLIIGAFMCKGFTGLFPLGFYFVHWIAFRNYGFAAMIFRSILLLLVTAVLFVPLMLYEPSAHSFTMYIKTQVLSSIGGLREPVGHFFIVKRLLMEMAIFLPLTLIIIVALYKNGAWKDHPYRRHSLFFLLTALSGSLPIMISQKQSGFYALASIPFFALSAAAIAAPLVKRFLDQVNTKALLYRGGIALVLCAFFFIAAYSATSFGNPRRHRDGEKLHLVHLVGPVAKGQVIGACSSIWHDWTLHGYFVRYYNISLDDKNEHGFYLSDTCSAFPLKRVESVNLHLSNIKLYSRTAR